MLDDIKIGKWDCKNIQAHTGAKIHILSNLKNHNYLAKFTFMRPNSSQKYSHFQV